MGERLRIVSFGGTAPRTDPRLLEPGQARVATNLILTSGAIRPYQALKLVTATLVAGVQSVFRFNGPGGERWLSWAAEVDVARGPVPGDVSQRLYWTGDGEPRMTTYALASAGGGPYPTQHHVLGVFRPAASPTATPSGGSGLDVDRFYRRTFVTPLGEESGPSPVGTVATGKPNATWALAGLGAPPGNTFTVSGATWSAGTATVTVPSTYGLRVGERTAVSAVVPAGYNGQVTITGLTSTTISYAVASNPGVYSSGGSVARVSPHNLVGGRQRIYRTVVSSGITKWRFVVELPIANTTYNDTILDANVGEEMPSELWDMPPTNMRGLIALPNGVMAGFAGNELVLSEPNQPHAWNPNNRKIADSPIVAIAHVGNVVVVGTTGVPYRAMGTFPDGVEWIRDESKYPCLSKPSMRNITGGVLYASTPGLIFCDGTSFAVTSMPFYTEKEWTLLHPETMVAEVHANRYYCRYSQGGSTGSMFILDRNEPAAHVNATVNPSAIYSDAETRRLYMLMEGFLYEWDAGIGERLLFDWWSKEFVIPKPKNMAWVKVDADFSQDDAVVAAAQALFDAVVAANQALIASLLTDGSLNETPLNSIALNGSRLQRLPPLVFSFLNLTLYADGVVRATRTIRSSKPVRVPSGYKADTFSLRLTGNVGMVMSVMAAETIEDLKAV